MNRHWLLRVGDGINFKKSSKYNIWGISQKWISFQKEVKIGDILWFVINGNKGKIIAMSTYVSHNERVLGPLINTSFDNNQLGWSGDGNWNIEIKYDNLYNIEDCELFSNIKNQNSVRKYNKNTININLSEEYKLIIKYSKIKENF